MNSDQHTNDSDDRTQQELDELLTAWHEEVDGRARAARERVLGASGAASGSSETRSILRRILMNRYLPYAAIIALAALVVVYALPQIPANTAYAQDGVVMLPDGGRLDAFGPDGNEIGPCALEHTDVAASVSGHFVRVDVEQIFGNPYDTTIEAVYTFPLSHRGAVDRMRMTIRSGDVERIVEGEIEERERARQIYENARDAGYVASLLEQERPNIFTQSVANIEPGAQITILISYVETLEEIDGTYKVVFPTVVGPRYIPGYPTGGMELPPGCAVRQGIVLRGPATFALDDDSVADDESDLSLLAEATPIAKPAWTNEETQPKLLKSFKVSYTDGSGEPGAFFDDNTGVIGGRWFCWQPPTPGAPFAEGTDQVPDASKITPMPVRPGTRAGHDISITVEIETGGTHIATAKAPLHEIVEVAPADGKGSKGRKVFELASKNEIPNRDFVLEWTLGEEGIAETVLATAKSGIAHPLDGAEEGVVMVDGHLAVILNPPPRVEDADVPARELVFVLDTSGSMSGFPIEKAKAVMTRAIDAMRPEDTFNLITFAGDTHILWETPRPATKENRAIANQFVKSRQGGGGTEMMTAINAALSQNPNAGIRLTAMKLADLPADGRSVKLRVAYVDLNSGKLKVNDALSIPVETSIALPEMPGTNELEVDLDGRWITKDSRRVLVIDTAAFVEGADTSTAPMRIVVFMTDGYVGNEQAIIAAIRENAKTTRVFSFGIGNSINRYLLDEMAKTGRGEVEYVLLTDGADKAVERLSRRIQTPVLIDLSMETEGIELLDVLPSGDHLPDLYDEKPIVILARYTKPGSGTITLRGRTGKGPWSREIQVDLPAEDADHDVVATLWARERVDEILNPHLYLAQLQTDSVADSIKEQVIALGKKHSIMTPFTSFVAVEKTRVVSDGKPMLVHVPIELPSGTDWAGFFGNNEANPIDASLEQIALGLPEPPVEVMETSDFAADTRVTGEIGESDMALGEKLKEGRDGAPVAPPVANLGLAFSGPAAAPSSSRADGRSTHVFFAEGSTAGTSISRQGMPAPGAPSARGGNMWFGRGGGGGGRRSRGIGTPETYGAELDETEMEVDALGEKEHVEETAPGLPSYLEPEQFQRLAHVLDRPLFRVAIMSLLPKDILSSWEFSNEDSLLKLFRAPVLVSVKLDNVDDERLAALEKAGFELVGTNETTGVVVGKATARQLVEIGLLPGVLRVVPTSIQPDEAS